MTTSASERTVEPPSPATPARGVAHWFDGRPLRSILFGPVILLIAFGAWGATAVTVSQRLWIAVAMVLLVAGEGLLYVYLRFRMYKRHLHYDPATDYQYSFDVSACQRRSIELTSGGFTWESIAGAPDSALLGMRLRTTFRGYMREPYLEIRCRTVCFRQYVERGTKGSRFVNISPVIGGRVQPGDAVSIRGVGLAWDPGDAQLFLFTNGPLRHKRVVVIAPHPDDAELSAFYLYSTTHATLVTLTAGDAEDDPYRLLMADREFRYCTRAALRVWDSITVPFIGGVPPAKAINLGYFDGRLEDMYAEPDVEVCSPFASVTGPRFFRRHNLSSLLPVDGPATWSALVEDLTVLFNKLRPDIIVTPHPELDNHRDHQFATVAVCQALQASTLKEGRLLLYTNHPPTNEMYPFGPQDGMVSLPRHTAGACAIQGILSLEPAEEFRHLKLLALDAMTALRDLPFEPPRRRHSLLTSTLTTIYSSLGLLGEDTSYARRALRPNELFVVCPFKNAAQLAQRFLEGDEPARLRKLHTP